MADLTTLAKANQWIYGVSTPHPDTDDLVTRLISVASVELQNLITRTIALSNYDEVRNGLGGRRMVLFNSPIASVSSVSVNGIAIPARPAFTATAPAAGFSFDLISVMLTQGYEFCTGYQNVAISYSAGFATTPADVEQACLDTVADWFKYRDRTGKSSEGIEGQSVSFTNMPIPIRAAGIMQKYNNVAPAY